MRFFWKNDLSACSRLTGASSHVWTKWGNPGCLSIAGRFRSLKLPDPGRFLKIWSKESTESANSGPGKKMAGPVVWPVPGAAMAFCLAMAEGPEKSSAPLRKCGKQQLVSHRLLSVFSSLLFHFFSILHIPWRWCSFWRFCRMYFLRIWCSRFGVLELGSKWQQPLSSASSSSCLVLPDIIASFALRLWEFRLFSRVMNRCIAFWLQVRWSRCSGVSTAVASLKRKKKPSLCVLRFWRFLFLLS